MNKITAPRPWTLGQVLLAIATTGLILLFLALFVATLVAPALADTVSVQPAYDDLNELLRTLIGGALLALTGWLARVVKSASWLPAFIREPLQAHLLSKLDGLARRYADLAMDEINDLEAAHSSIEVDGWLQARALELLVSNHKALIRWVGIDKEELAAKILAHLPVPPGEPGAAAPVTPVERRELPPI